METRRAKRNRSEVQAEAEECCVCMDAPAEILQRECGHAVLCVQCAFRVQFGVHRACPMCRAPVLCPFVHAKTYTAKRLDASSGFEAMKFAQSSIMHSSQYRPRKSHDAMIRSLEGILPLMPDDCSKAWFTVVRMACEVSTPKICMEDILDRVASRGQLSERFAFGLIFECKNLSSEKCVAPIKTVMAAYPESIPIQEWGKTVLRRIADGEPPMQHMFLFNGEAIAELTIHVSTGERPM